MPVTSTPTRIRLVAWASAVVVTQPSRHVAGAVGEDGLEVVEGPGRLEDGQLVGDPPDVEHGRRRWCPGGRLDGEAHPPSLPPATGYCPAACVPSSAEPSLPSTSSPSRNCPTSCPGRARCWWRSRRRPPNFVDALLVQGLYQLKPALPFTPGMEVAGTVVALGDGARGRRGGRPGPRDDVRGRVRLAGAAARVQRRADPRGPVGGSGGRPGAELRHDALRPHPPDLRRGGGVGRGTRGRRRHRPGHRRRRQGARGPGGGLRLDDRTSSPPPWRPAPTPAGRVRRPDGSRRPEGGIRRAATGGGADVLVDPGRRGMAEPRSVRSGGWAATSSSASPPETSPASR